MEWELITYILDGIICLSDYGNILYHNNVNAGVKNKLIVKNCYTTGIIRGGQYGASTEETLMIVSNCHASSVLTQLVDSDNYKNENIKLISWNNETTN